MTSPAGTETSIACRGLPYARSSSSRIAAILAVSLFAFSAKRASSTIAAGACWRASSCTSPRTLGRPPGLPLWPLRNFNFLLSVTDLFSGNIIACGTVRFLKISTRSSLADRSRLSGRGGRGRAPSVLPRWEVLGWAVRGAEEIQSLQKKLAPLKRPDESSTSTLSSPEEEQP